MSHLAAVYKRNRSIVGIVFKCSCCGRHIKSKRSTLHNSEIRLCQKCTCASRRVRTPALCSWGCEECPAHTTDN